MGLKQIELWILLFLMGVVILVGSLPYREKEVCRVYRSTALVNRPNCEGVWADLPFCSGSCYSSYASNPRSNGSTRVCRACVVTELARVESTIVLRCEKAGGRKYNDTLNVHRIECSCRKIPC